MRCAAACRRRASGCGADEHADLAVPVPAECGDATRQLAVVLAGEDRVDDQRLEARVPEPAGLGGAGVDVGRGERDLARVEQDGLAQRLVAVLDPVLDDLDRDPDELQRLLQAHRAQQFARGGAEHVGRDPRGRLGVVEPGDEGRDARLRDEPDRAAPAGRHVAVPGQRVFEPLERRRRQLARQRPQPGERLLLRPAAVRALDLAASSSRRPPIRWFPRSRRAAGTSRSPARGSDGSTSPRSASDCSVRTTIDGPSILKKRRPAARVSLKPKPSAPSVA